MTNVPEADITGFLDKLAAFRETLSAGEQEIFDATLTAALSTGIDEVQGFDARPPVVQQGLMGQMMSNLVNLQYETLKNAVYNLRA